MNDIVLRLLAGNRVEWIDAQRIVHEGWPPPREDRRVTVLVPSEMVVLLELARPAGSDRQLAQALPFLVEEQLVAPIETQHVAWAPANESNRLRVAAVSRAQLDDWLSALCAGGIEPDALIPESLALPWVAERPILLIDNQRFVMRLGESSALSGSLDELPGFLAAAGIANPQNAIETWTVADGAASAPWPAQRGVAHALHACTDAIGEIALNLLQGNYSPRRRSKRLDTTWRWAIGATALALFALLLAPIAERQMLAGEVAAQRAEMDALLKRALPNAGAIADPARQLQSALGARGLGQGDSLMDLLSRAAPAIATDSRLVVDSLDYRDRRLELIVQAEGVGNLDALRQRLARTGLTAEIASSTPGTRGIQGRLRIGDSP